MVSFKQTNILKEVTDMQHTIFGLISLYIAAFALWIVKEVNEAKDFGLLSDWSKYFD